MAPAPPAPPPDLTAPSAESVPPADDGSAQGGLMLWGYYQIGYDVETRKLEVIPLRHSEYTFNMNMFLQPPLGDADNIGLAIHDASQFMSTGRIDLDISITHPFPNLKRLRGFDVMGVLMGNGSLAGHADPSVVYPQVGNETILLNADGYTRWMNASEFTATGVLGFTPGVKGKPAFNPSSTISGYKYYSEFLAADEDLPTFFQTPLHVEARGSFKAGSTLTRRYEIQFAMSGGKPQLWYQYAILASWASPDPASLPDPDVSDFPPQANLQEAFHIAITDDESDLYYAGPSDLGGTLRLKVEVFDWQGASNPQGVEGELAHLWIENSGGDVIPGGSFDMLPTATVSPGTGCSEIFTVEVPGCTPVASGEQEFLITAESADPDSYDQGFSAPYPEDAPLAAFTRFSATVGTESPCPTPTITSMQQIIVNKDDVWDDFEFYGTNFIDGPDLYVELQRDSGNIVGSNVTVESPALARVDLDFTGYEAGMYHFYFRNGCGKDAIYYGFEVNTPPTSTGITGPAVGDASMTNATYHSHAYDADTDWPDLLAVVFTLYDPVAGSDIIGPDPGDPFVFSFAPLQIGNYEVKCLISDGYPPANLNLTYPVSRVNTPPYVSTPGGQSSVWMTDVVTYSVVSTELDSWQTLTHGWSVVQQGSPHSYTLPGDADPTKLTIDYSLATYITGPGWYEISCQVDDGSGAPNAIATSPLPLSVYAADMLYTDPIPPAQLSQVVVQGSPSLQGIAGCPSYWDEFYAPLGAVPFSHPDVSVLSGPSLGMPGVMVIADEPGIIAGPYPPPPPLLMGFAHYACPYSSGTAPSWTWWTTGLSPNGPDMIPSVIHFDGNSQGELFYTNSQMTGKLWGVGTDDPCAFQHCVVGAPWLNDLYTSLPGALTPDVAVDTTAGFDMGSPGSPMSAPMYGLYTQDLSGILASCNGLAAGAPAGNPVNFLQFPPAGVQPVGTAVDAPGSVGVVAPLAAGLVGAGPGLFGILPGAAVPGGNLVFPEPYYALAIDDDPSDNPYPCNLPPPVNWWVMAATIDADRDLEVYEIDFGVPPPGPATIQPYCTVTMGAFLGGNPTAYPVDCEFISNFSNFGNTLKPRWAEDLLAVLITDPATSAWQVEIYAIVPGAPAAISVSQPVVVPQVTYAVGGVAYRLDVDEVTGDLYVIHEDAAGSGDMAVTVIPY